MLRGAALVDEVLDLLAYGDRLVAKRHARRRSYGDPKIGQTFYKVDAGEGDADDDREPDDGDDEPTEHARIKPAHHAAMAEAYGGIARLHRAMRSHYEAATGGHQDDDDDEAGSDGAPEDSKREAAFEKGGITDAELAVLAKAAERGSTDARLALARIGRNAIASCLRAGPRYGIPK